MLSTQLKEKTSTAHQQVEKIVVGKLKHIRREEDYVNLLICFFAYFSALEKVVQPFVTDKVLPDIDLRRKAAALRSDIEALSGTTDLLPEVGLPVINGLPAALGAMYVMEGSVMGGPIIVGMLQKAGIKKGFGFFSGYGTRTGLMWSQFLDIVNQVADEVSQNMAITAANETFSHFAEVFQTSDQLTSHSLKE